MISRRDPLTHEASFFLSPDKPLHRQYEALRAYFVDSLSSKEAAQSFGYSPGAFRVLCPQFRHDPHMRDRFFKDVQRGPHAAPKRDAVRERVVALRKRNLSVYDIQRELEAQGHQISINALSVLLREEGFARLPRRRDDERPDSLRPEPAAVADVRELDLSPRRFRTDFAGLFLFVPFLCTVDLDRLLAPLALPATQMIPAPHAVRTMLGLKLLGKERTSHVMEMVFDPGIALFAGLNVVPKRSFLSAYSARVDPRVHLQILSAWNDAVHKAGLARGSSFDLDFHSVPANSAVEPLEKYYVSKRSRSQKGILTFLVRDAEQSVLCYSNAGIPKDKRAGEVLRFAEFWKKQTGSYPEELVFDSQLTTYRYLQALNERKIGFITLRRRSRKMLARIYALPAGQWRRITLPALTRTYRTPRILDETVELQGYKGPMRQIVVVDLGHEEPTILLTNHLHTSAQKLITRYAQRMLIENDIADAINFFHIDALSSMVGLKVNFDLLLTLMASSLYRLMAKQIGREYRRATAETLFRKLFDMSADVEIGETTITVELAKRAHNPILMAAGLADNQPPVPWLGNKRLILRFA